MPIESRIVHDPVGVEERVEGLVFHVYQSAHVVREDAVKPDVPKPSSSVAAQELRLPIGTESERRVTAADGVFPVMRERAGRLPKVASERNHSNE